VDFTLGEIQQAVAEAAAHVLGQAQARPATVPPGPATAQAPPGPALAQAPGPGTAQDEAHGRALWKELGQAGLLGLALPDWLGGEGLGVLDVAVLLMEAGRAAAPVPALATLLMGALPVTRHGGRDAQRALLAGVADGAAVLTAAVREPSDPMPLAPATTASVPGGTVSGVKIGVPYCAAASWVLVPASLSTGGTGIVVVDPSADGVTVRRTPASAGGPEYTLRLDQAPIAHLLGGGTDGRAVADLYQLTAAGACCLADGALAAALVLTTEHVRSRTQFGRPLAAFQAVAQRIADVSIASRTLRLATLSACWRLDTGRDAAGDVDVAAYWLAEEAPAALRACHHLHGGTGMDVSYPLHRYSALIKDLVRLVGGADYRLARVGAGIGP
jgi:alkylation response protein AidB-like acyl-CoA dehydrogenase